jgi:hypothetical protein
LPAAEAEGLVHVGEERGGGQPAPVRDQHRGFGERARILACHEGAGAELHVHHEALSRGELLRQDRRGDEIDRFHRRGHVADGVEALVRGREIAVWPMIAQPTSRVTRRTGSMSGWDT